MYDFTPDPLRVCSPFWPLTLQDSRIPHTVLVITVSGGLTVISSARFVGVPI